MTETIQCVTEHYEICSLLFPYGLYSLLFFTPSEHCPEWAKRRYNESLLLHRDMLKLADGQKEVSE